VLQCFEYAFKAEPVETPEEHEIELGTGSRDEHGLELRTL
jgi:hypothetical protein